jgi:GT2 family glycosyltransferase
MSVDVVVVNYHTPDLLTNFIRSYEESRFENCTLTIVDVEGNTSLINKEKSYNTYYITNNNVGYGAACNIGAKYGKNDVILLANSDTLLTSGLKECHDALMSRDDWGILGPRQVDENNNITCAGIFGPYNATINRGWHEPDVGQYQDVVDDCPYVNGSLLFIKRALWEELTNCPDYLSYSPKAVGAFLETPHYYEETYCCYHARYHGYKCVYYGLVTMTHLWHKSSPFGNPTEFQTMERSKSMYREACALHGIPQE